jgi:predicted NBD/HSP70 family sugar kinase
VSDQKGDSARAILAGAAGGDPLLTLIRSGRAQTRADLIKLTGLSRSTVSARVDALLRSSLVVAAGEEASTGGRPATLLRFNGSVGVVLAADLGAAHAHVALADLAGAVVTETRQARDIATGPDETLSWLARTARELLAAAGRAPDDLLGAAVGLPGPVEFAAGRPVSPPIMPGWDGYPVMGYLRDTLKAPVCVDNDVNVMALGEWSLHWPDISDFVLVKAATGIGGGIISNGRMTRGAQGSAGDIGHIPLAGHGDIPCACGNYGCLEAVVGGRALAAKLSGQGIPTEGADGVIAHVRGGVPAAVAAIRDAGRAIGQVLATLVSTLNPSVVVLGGALTGAGDALLAGVREVVYQRCPPLATRDLRIVGSRAGDAAGVAGAAALINGRLLDGRSDRDRWH